MSRYHFLAWVVLGLAGWKAVEVWITMLQYGKHLIE